MAVLRWVIRDPYDTNPATNTYTFPRNPREMSSIYPDRTINVATSTHGRVILTEGTTPPKQFTFAGPVLEKSHFDALRKWSYEHRRRLIITDHFGRKITCVLTSVDLVPQKRLNYYYSHEYTVNGLAIKVTEPTVPNAGYQP